MPMIELECPQCRTVLELDAGFAGGVCRCASCGALIDVPTRGPASGPKRPAAQALEHKAAAGAVTRQGNVEDEIDDLFTTGEFLDRLFEAGDVFEVRALDVVEKPGSSERFGVSGFFDNTDKASRAVAQLEKLKRAAGIYVTVNPVRADLLQRSPNKLTERFTAVTRDGDVPKRRWFPIVMEPERPAGVMSSETELQRCVSLADQIVDDLTDEDWPEPIISVTGNGVQVLYRVALPGEDGGLLARALAALAQRYAKKGVSFDPAGVQPAHLSEVMGTTLRKGRNLSKIEGAGEPRPHRMSVIRHMPSEAVAVDKKLLEALAAKAPASAPMSAPDPGSKPQAPRGRDEAPASRTGPGAPVPGTTAPGLSDPAITSGVGAGGPAAYAASAPIPQTASAPEVEVASVSRKLARTLDRLSETHRDGLLGLPCGVFPWLDQHTLGLRGVIALLGESGAGKTAFAMQMGLGVVRQSPDACFVLLSLDMEGEDLRRRMLAAATGVPWRDLVVGVRGRKIAEAEDGLRLTDEQREGYVPGLDQLRKLAERVCIVDAAGQPAIDAAFLERITRDFKRKTHSHRALLVIDSAQSLPSPWPSPDRLDRLRHHLQQARALVQRGDGDALVLLADPACLPPDAPALLTASCDALLTIRTGAPGEKGESARAELALIKGREGFTPGRVALRLEPQAFRFAEPDR